MTIQRTTTVIQKLETTVSLGEVPRTQRPATIRVQRKSDGHIMKINAKDYRTDAFLERDYIELGEVDPDEGMDAAPLPPPRLDDSLYTADELATMRIKDLRNLPEFTRVGNEARKSLRTKQEYINAILENRRSQHGEEPRRATLD